MANRFHGSYRKVAARVDRGDGSKMPRGIARMNREEKRVEAEERNAATHPEQRRSFARQFGYSRNSDRIRNGLVI